MGRRHADPVPAGGVLSPRSGPAWWTGGWPLAAWLVVPALFLLEIHFSGTIPAALLAAGLATYGLLCLVSLESAILVLIVCTPFSMEMRVPGTGSALQIPIEPMLLVALLAWVFRILARGSHRWVQPRFSAVLLLALGASLLSLVWTSYKFDGIKAVANGTWYALLGVFIMNNFRSRPRLEALAASLVISGAALTLYSLVNVGFGRFVPSMGYWFAWPFFSEHGSFAAFLSFPFALALAFAVESRGPVRLLLGLIVLAIGGQIVLSLTRAAWLGLLALPPLFLVSMRRQILRPGYLILAVAGSLIVAVLIARSGAVTGLTKTSHTITDPTTISNLERVNRWYAGWRMFQEHPVTGVGYGTYSENYLHFRRFPVGTEQSGQRMGVHSEYLRVLSETGLVGASVALLALLLLGGTAARAIRRAPDRFCRTAAIGLSGGLLTYLVHAFLNNYLEFDKVAVPVWTCIGGLGALETMSRPATRRAGETPDRLDGTPPTP